MNLAPRMKRLASRRPSPAMVVSIIALVVACAGTATAARLLITSPAQVKSNVLSGRHIKNASLTGADIKSASITSKQIRKSSLRSLADSAGRTPGTSAQEVVRKMGPSGQKANTAARVLTLSGLAPGTYAIFAKASMTSNVSDLGLLNELVKQPKTAAGRCRLNAAGDEDSSVHPLATPYSNLTTTFNMHMTRTLASAGDVFVQCEAPIEWGASDSSIVAIRLASSERGEVGG
jgi:hypothetical protein